ncbi:MAG: HD domain-containing protein [Bacteroidales bacterium]|nr:HD domain-containing protein [Bacteroidales bacterium]
MESRWLEPVSQFVDRIFRDVYLPSHDMTHHIRTWENAKKLLLETYSNPGSVGEDIVEALLFTTLFHDTGMTETKGKSHGTASRIIYESYINNFGYLPSKHNEICHTIELHDNKKDDIFHKIEKEGTPDILTLTGIADDLDALGTVGIYRYAEIYLHRNSNFRILGSSVISNVAIRYSRLLNAISALPGMASSVTKDYKIILDFYTHYNQDIDNTPNLVDAGDGQIGVIKLIREYIMNQKIHPSAFASHPVLQNADPFVRNFFNTLKNEYEPALT